MKLKVQINREPRTQFERDHPIEIILQTGQRLGFTAADADRLIGEIQWNLIKYRASNPKSWI